MGHVSLLLLPLLVICAAVRAIQPLSNVHAPLKGWHKVHHGPQHALAASVVPSDIHQRTFVQPLDHFHGTTNLTFQQRYWITSRHYLPSPGVISSSLAKQLKPVVPIFLLESGETSGANRLPYLDYGIIDILTRATGGIGVILEHRYYGTSHPRRSAFGPGKRWTVDELRWLDNNQSEQDSARFADHIDELLREYDPSLDSSTHPIIVYGGSYAGARAARLRKRFPDTFWGAIASSAVTAALEEFPQYMYGIARGNNVTSIQAIQAAIVAIDGIIATETDTASSEQLQKEFLKLLNLEGLSDLADVAELLMQPLGDYQSVNWDDLLSPPTWARFLQHMASNPQTDSFGSLRSHADDLDLSTILPDESLRLINYVKDAFIDPCRKKLSADACLANDWESFIEEEALSAGKAWSFQVCTEWGYFITAPPKSHLNQDPSSPVTFVPASGPKLISSLLDLNRTSEVCRKGFSDGEHFTMPARPNLSNVNRLGGFDLEADRLAFVDGEYDPWREATPHSDTFAFGGARPSTLSRPFILIPNATHHWDENGPRPKHHSAPPDGGSGPESGHYHLGQAGDQVQAQMQTEGQMTFPTLHRKEEGIEEIEIIGQEVSPEFVVQSTRSGSSMKGEGEGDGPAPIPAPDYILRTHSMLVASVESWIEEWKKKKV